MKKLLSVIGLAICTLALPLPVHARWAPQYRWVFHTYPQPCNWISNLSAQNGNNTWSWGPGGYNGNGTSDPIIPGDGISTLDTVFYSSCCSNSPQPIGYWQEQQSLQTGGWQDIIPTQVQVNMPANCDYLIQEWTLAGASLTGLAPTCASQPCLPNGQ